MPELLKNDDKRIRSCILNDVLGKIPINKSYENLCKVIGNDAIAFYDFQYWYYRFMSGKQDLDFDRSSEPEPLQFSDLPVDAVGLIVDKLEVVERLMLRKVSRPLRDFMEKQEFDCIFIDVCFGNDLIIVTFEIEQVAYAKNDEAVKFYEKKYGVCDSLIIYGGESEVCNDLACVLKNLKLPLSFFGFSNMGPCYEARVLSTFFTKFEYALKSLKHQIAVRELELRPEHPDNLLAILPYLRPGHLEEISIGDTTAIFDWKSDENVRKVEQIIQLDQWKQAEELILLDSLHLFPDEVFVQFKKYRIKVWSLNRSQLNNIGMKFAASPVFEYCRFEISGAFNDRYLIDSIGIPGPLAEGYRSVRHLMIPNTDKMLVFKEQYGDIEIEKKTRDAQ